MVSQFMVYGLIAYMVGVVITRFVSAEVGEVIRIVGAVVFVLAWILTFVR